MKKVLFVTSEAVPFIKTGGLADVAGSLPQYFDKSEYEVRIILPKYVCMDEELKKQMHFLSRFYVRLSWRSREYVWAPITRRERPSGCPTNRATG